VPFHIKRIMRISRDIVKNAMYCIAFRHFKTPLLYKIFERFHDIDKRESVVEQININRYIIQ
jgi:hypothetical protein